MRFALIGCGELGRAYAAALRELGVDAEFCVDRRASAARAAAALCGAKAVADATKVLADSQIDAVIVSVASSGRLDLLRRAAAQCVRTRHERCWRW